MTQATAYSTTDTFLFVCIYSNKRLHIDARLWHEYTLHGVNLPVQTIKIDLRYRANWSVFADKSMSNKPSDVIRACTLSAEVDIAAPLCRVT